MKQILGYLFLLLCTVYLFLLYNEPVVSGILIFECLYPLLAFLYLSVVSKSLRTNLERVPSMGETGKPIRAGITINNQNHIAALRYTLCLTLHNTLGSSKEKQRLTDTISGNREKTFWYEFSSEQAGTVQLSLNWIRVYDFLGIFGRKIPCSQQTLIRILPQFDLMPLEISKKTRDFQAESEIYSSERQGDDPSELYQVRPYRPMDSLKDIHWKLSAKEEELIIKERGFPLGCVVRIWINFSKCSRPDLALSKILTAVASLSLTLAEEHCIHMAAWYEEKNSRIIKWPVYQPEDTYTLIWRMLELQPYHDLETAEICRQESFQGQETACEVTVDSDGRILKNEETQEFLRL